MITIRYNIDLPILPERAALVIRGTAGQWEGNDTEAGRYVLNIRGNRRRK